MSAQRLSEKSVRRIAASTGLTILRAWSHGGYTMNFVTDDHKHGTWNKPSGEWEFDKNPTHYSSCRDLFPGWEPRPPKKGVQIVQAEPTKQSLATNTIIFNIHASAPNALDRIAGVAVQEPCLLTGHRPAHRVDGGIECHDCGARYA